MCLAPHPGSPGGQQQLLSEESRMKASLQQYFCRALLVALQSQLRDFLSPR